MFVTFRRRPISPFIRALLDWREASRLVSTRWQTFAAAEDEARGFAFASYLRALDAEEAAARQLARLCSVSSPPRMPAEPGAARAAPDEASFATAVRVRTDQAP